MINFKKKKSIILLFLLFFNYSMVLSSQRINSIKVENKQENKRIISLSPSITETLFYFGYGDNVIGRTDYCITPEEAKKIPSMGTMFAPNMERILLGNPQYIIEQTHFDRARERIFNSIGIKTLPLKTPKTIEDIIESYRKIIYFLENDALEIEEKIASLKKIEKFVEEIRVQGKNLKNRPKVYYSLGGGHTEYTAGKDSFIDEIITLAGGDNIVKEIGWTYSLEGLLYNQPDIIILSKKRYYAMINDNKYKDLVALKNERRVILIEEDEITLPTPRLLLETLDKIQKGILEYNSL